MTKSQESKPKSDAELLIQSVNEFAERQKASGNFKPEIELETIKIKSDCARLYHEHFSIRLEERTKLMAEAIGFAKITINTLVIVNAGAILVVLAFLGNVTKAGCIINEISFLANFIWALMLIICASASAYLCQLTFIELKAPWNNIAGNIFRAVGILLAIGSIICFGNGGFSAQHAFVKGSVVTCAAPTKENN